MAKVIKEEKNNKAKQLFEQVMDNSDCFVSISRFLEARRHGRTEGLIISCNIPSAPEGILVLPSELPELIEFLSVASSALNEFASTKLTYVPDGVD